MAKLKRQVKRDFQVILKSGVMRGEPQISYEP